ncbi:MAG: hypothetical protein JNK25_07910 [Phycisphaerae bacterium]|nr:hypothetical protein [Phycisphaerae bacterium]
MSESYQALCTDFYVNQKLVLKMELPKARETVLDLFERLRRQFPAMANFRRYKDEFALESPQSEMPHRWAAMRSNVIRSGTVNPSAAADAYALHQLLLEVAPTYLSISPLDVDCLELLFGFDLSAGGNHDAIVHDALLGGSPLAALADVPGASIIECQPMMGLSLTDMPGVEAFIEVKTRGPHHPSRDPEAGDPISVFLTLRRTGPVAEVKELPGILRALVARGEDLVQHRIVPGLLVPLREAIASGNA